ncbi:MAG: protease modulator HflC [Planctomycetota bacterium]|jgi:membrane protease subunit HflC
MKSIWTVVFILVVIAILALSAVTFQVRETETVIVTRFGEPVRTITEPGLKFKFPIPIEDKEKFDSRNRLFEATSRETPTAGGEPIIVQSYMVWKIADPEKFLISVKDVKDAEVKIKSQLQDAQNSVIGRHSFSELVNTDADKIQFEQIENEIAGMIQGEALENYGVEIRTVGIKRLKISKEVTEKVFERMKADRDRKTQAILAEGNAEAERITSDAAAKQKELLAVADSQAKAIRGAGDAEAARYLEMLKEDPELAIFLRNIEALKEILAERSTIVLGTDTEPVKYLKEIPDIQPASTSQAGD